MKRRKETVRENKSCMIYIRSMLVAARTAKSDSEKVELRRRFAARLSKDAVRGQINEQNGKENWL